MAHFRFLAVALAVGVIGSPISSTYAQVDLGTAKKQDTRVYDIRDLLPHPKTATAESVVKIMLSAIDPESWNRGTPNHGSVHIINGTRLSIRTTAVRHGAIADLLAAMRRRGGVSVVVQARLYEVDRELAKKVAAAKRLYGDELEKLEQQFIAGKTAGSSFERALEKQKEVQAGEEVGIADGLESPILSRMKAVSCLPSPAHAIARSRNPQIVFAGVSFQVKVQVTPDRRFVPLSLTERVCELQEISRRKVATQDGEVQTDVPILDRHERSEMLEVPDGGTILRPVHFWPQAAKDKRWILSISPRIRIEEEERTISQGALQELLPALLRDVLTNPCLKTTRDFCGTPGDSRFALINSKAWTWPKDFQPSVPGHPLTTPRRTGNRLLGIRIDRYDPAGTKPYHVIVSLVNAGGNANGAVVGACMLQYVDRSREKVSAVQLVDAGP